MKPHGDPASSREIKPVASMDSQDGKRLWSRVVAISKARWPTKAEPDFIILDAISGTAPDRNVHSTGEIERSRVVRTSQGAG